MDLKSMLMEEKKNTTSALLKMLDDGVIVGVKKATCEVVIDEDVTLQNGEVKTFIRFVFTTKEETPNKVTISKTASAYATRVLRKVIKAYGLTTEDIEKGDFSKMDNPINIRFFRDSRYDKQDFDVVEEA